MAELYVKETLRDDGTKSIVYGENIDSNGRIGDPHGHIAFTKDNVIDYVRSPENSRNAPIYDSKNDPKKS